jgi:hypothetical protein
MIKRARERAAPFAQIDFLALTKDPNVSAEELTSLRNLAQTAFEDVRFLEQEQGNFLHGHSGQAEGRVQHEREEVR